MISVYRLQLSWILYYPKRVEKPHNFTSLIKISAAYVLTLHSQMLGDISTLFSQKTFDNVSTFL